MIQVAVDADRCEGHGICEATAGDVFALNAEGIAHVLLDPVPDAFTVQAEAAVRACPVAAIKRLETAATPTGGGSPGPLPGSVVETEEQRGSDAAT